METQNFGNDSIIYLLQNSQKLFKHLVDTKYDNNVVIPIERQTVNNIKPIDFKLSFGENSILYLLNNSNVLFNLLLKSGISTTPSIVPISPTSIESKDKISQSPLPPSITPPSITPPSVSTPNIPSSTSDLSVVNNITNNLKKFQDYLTPELEKPKINEDENERKELYDLSSTSNYYDNSSTKGISIFIPKTNYLVDGIKRKIIDENKEEIENKISDIESVSIKNVDKNGLVKYNIDTKKLER